MLPQHVKWRIIQENTLNHLWAFIFMSVYTHAKIITVVKHYPFFRVHVRQNSTAVKRRKW